MKKLRKQLLGRDDSMTEEGGIMIELVISGKPIAKQRPRVVRNWIANTPQESVNY